MAKLVRVPLGPEPLYKRWLKRDPVVVDIVNEWRAHAGRGGPTTTLNLKAP